MAYKRESQSAELLQAQHLKKKTQDFLQILADNDHHHTGITTDSV